MGEKTEMYGSHIVQYAPEYSFCAGCAACELLCALLHDGVTGPSYNRIFVNTGTHSRESIVQTCRHCADHPCYEACPKKDKAMRLDENGIAYIDETECVGCRACIRACRFDPPRINYVGNEDKKKRKAKKCDLCRTRAKGPACIEYCQVRCIGLSSDPLPAAIINENGGEK